MRTRFYQLRKVYKSLCRKLKRRYDQQSIKKLETLQTTDPNKFWNLLKQLRTGKKFVSNKEDLPPSEETPDHYMKLLQKQTVCNSFNNEKIKLRNKLNLAQLDKTFDLEEIKQGIERLKSKNVPGIDCISSEMIKCSNNDLLSKIVLFLTLVTTQKHGVKDLFIQYSKVFLKWTLQTIEESLY